jgi:hypothetical protein
MELGMNMVIAPANLSLDSFADIQLWYLQINCPLKITDTVNVSQLSILPDHAI